LNQAQVAELFGTTVQTIITWKKKGKIPFFQLGRFPIFSKKQLTIVASKNQHLLRS
jgi:predicted site-specific integrase-resolvase